MAVLPSGTGLETLPDPGTQGWNAIHDDNIELVDDKLRGPFLANNRLGNDTQSDANNATASAPTIVTVTGTGNDADINSNIASLDSQLNAVIADNENLRTVINDLLEKLRRTTGCGVLDG